MKALIRSRISFKTILVISSFIIGLNNPAAAELKVATIDVGRVLNETKLAKEVKSRLDQKAEAIKRKIETKRDEVKDLQEGLEKDQSLIKEDNLKLLQSKQRDLARLIKDNEDEIREEFNEINRELTKNVMSEARKFSEKRGFDLVLTKSEKPRGLVLFSNESIDITEDVIKVIDQD